MGHPKYDRSYGLAGDGGGACHGGAVIAGDGAGRFEDFADLREAPVEVGLVDDQRRGEADDVGVGFLAEQAAAHELFAVGPRGAVELNADEEALAANLLDVRAADALDEVHRVGAEFRGALGELLVDDDAQRGARYGAGERVAAEGGTVVAVMDKAEDLARAEHRGDGIEPAGERLADDEHVRRDALMHVGEELAGAAKAGLDLVEHEQNVVLFAGGGDFAQVAVGRDEDAGLALDGLDEEGAGLRRDGAAQRVGVTEGDDLEARGERPETLAVLLFGGEADDGDGAAVEVVGDDDDLGFAFGDAFGFITPLAGELDR